MALGATQGHIMRAVVTRGLALTVLGLGIGALGAYRATGILEGYLFQLGAHDPVSFGAGIVVLTTASLLACAVPALRAARVDPLIVMRAE
jgi:putative ABC transport system permease protein